MSQHHSRAGKTEGHFSKQGRPESFGQHRRFSGGGNGGGSGGSLAAPPTSSASPAFPANQSFKKSDSGHGGQSRGSTVISKSDAAHSTGHDVANSKVLNNGSSVGPAIVNVKPDDPPKNQKIASEVPKAVAAQPSPVVSGAAGSSAQIKGDASGAFLQFGTISPVILNGMQIPARTASAPPNLDEQKRDQALHDSFRAVHTLPKPSLPKPQKQQKQENQQPSKDVEGVIKPSNGETHSPMHANRNIHAPVPSAPPPNATTTRSSALPAGGIPMPVLFQQPQIHFQFNGPNPPMPSQSVVASSLQMALPAGNASQAPQIFVPNMQPRPLQPQAIMRFTPQFGHQVPPQLSGMGIGIAPQFPQQQPEHFGIQRMAVKVTNPYTYEVLKLDTQTDSHTEAGYFGQRPRQNVSSQALPLPAFTPQLMNCYKAPYNPSQMVFPPSSYHLTNTQMMNGSPAARCGFPVSQNGQAISFMNPSSFNPALGCRTGSPAALHELANAVHSEGLLFSGPSSDPVQVTFKQAIVPLSEKNGMVSVRVSLPALRPGQQILSNLPGVVSSVPHQKNNKMDPESSVIIQKSKSELPGIVSSFAIDKNLRSATIGDSLSVIEDNDGKKNEAKQRLESIIDHQKMPSKPQEQQDMIGDDNDNGTRESIFNDCASIPSIPTADTPTSTTRLRSADVECNNSKSVLKTDVMRNSASVFPLENADQGHGRLEVACNKLSLKEADSTQTSISSNPSATGIMSETPSSVLDGRMIVEFGQKHKNLVAAQERGGELSDDTLFGSNSARESDISTTESVQKMPKALSHGVEQTPEKIISAEFDTSVGINSEVERTRVLITLPTSNSDSKDSAMGPFGRVPSILVEAKPLPLDSAINNCELPCCEDIDLDEFSTLPQENISLSPPAFSEIEKNMKGVVVQQSLGSPSVISGSIDKLGSNKARDNRKKKKRESLLKADAAGASDLYNAHKASKEKHDATANIAETHIRCSTSELKIGASQDCSKVAPAVEVEGQDKAEDKDWEEAADASTPKLRASDNDVERSQIAQERQPAGKKKYSRDFLLIISQQCKYLPEGFENGPEIADVLMCTPVDKNLEPHFSAGRLMDRFPGATRVDRRISGISDDEKWARAAMDFHMDLGHRAVAMGFRPGQAVNNGVLRNPRVQSHSHFTNGIQRGLFPSPAGPMQIMHKSSNRYEVGKPSDEEEKKQRQLKAILNKLTPENFKTLFSKVKDVKIDNAVTLSGVISQIFDKALMEPTFCEMYADFCLHLASELPDFLEKNEKITFRRLLLNKCQEEFERETEQAEANKAEEKAGEVCPIEEASEEKRIKARRRMLGNIRLIGELYKKKMLTERIMHDCIHKLFRYYQDPNEEDIESLCKLMSTIGGMIDHSKSKEIMDAYFERIVMLSTSEKLSFRLRFMLKDIIDLRKNKWQQRMKVEGPKKIEDVHKDAAQERQAQSTRPTPGQAKSTRPTRGHAVSSRLGPPANFGQRGTTILNSPRSLANPSIRGPPMQVRGFGSQDVRREDRQRFESRVMSVRLSQRPTDDGSVTLGPQGGLAKGMSGRGLGLMPNVSSVEISARSVDPHRLVSGSNVSDRLPVRSREDGLQKYMNDRLSDFMVTDAHAAGHSLDRSQVNTTSRERPTSSGGNVREASEAKTFSIDALRQKSMSAIREFYSANDEEEIVSCIKELNSPHFYPSMVSLWVTDSFERKDLERNSLAELLVSLSKARYSLISRNQLIAGFESVLSSLEDAVNDAPKAAEFLGRIFGKVIVENVVPLKEIGRLIRHGGEEPGSLVAFGLASEILFGIFAFIQREKGDSFLNEIRKGSNLRLEDFRPPKPTPKSKKLDAFL